MPEPEGPSPAFYDHEIDEPRAPGRRRRQVADWGVGEDVFDRLPSSRFDRRGEEHRSAGRHEDFIGSEGRVAARAGPRRLEPREDSPSAWRGPEPRDDSARQAPIAARGRGDVADWFEGPDEAAPGATPAAGAMSPMGARGGRSPRTSRPTAPGRS